jgi:hypothetical protein
MMTPQGQTPEFVANTPARTSLTVEKAADGSGAPATVVVPGNPQQVPGTVVEMNPKFVEKVQSDEAYAETVVEQALIKHAKQQFGNPFPRDSAVQRLN